MGLGQRIAAFALFLVILRIGNGLGFCAEERVLHVFTWDGYFAPAVIADFETQHGCRVEFDRYDSNDTMYEMLTGEDGYDIITPAINAVVPMNDRGWLLPLRHDLLPNRRFIDASSLVLANDPGMAFSVPYTATVTGIGYNKTMVPEDALGSWGILGDERLGKKMAMLNDMREVIGAGLKFLGYSANSQVPEEIAQAGEQVKTWKRNIIAFNLDSAREFLDDGVLAAIQTYSGDIASVEKTNGNIGFFVPEEGSVVNGDLFVIPADTAEPELAHAFINFFLDPANAARNMEYTRYYMPNPEALQRLDPAILEGDAFAAPQWAQDRCEPLHDVRPVRAVYDEAWTRVLLSE